MIFWLYVYGKTLCSDWLIVMQALSQKIIQGSYLHGSNIVVSSLGTYKIYALVLNMAAVHATKIYTNNNFKNAITRTLVTIGTNLTF